MEQALPPELDRRRVAFVYHSSAGPYTSDRLIARSVQSLATSVDEEFASLGLPSIFPDAETLDACALLEGVYAVLVKFREMRTFREDLEERILRLSSDLSHSRTICSRLQGDVERLQKENGAVSEKCRQAVVKSDSSRSLWRKEQEENKRLRIWLTQRDSQHLHETRRLENEIDRLKSKLNHLLLTDARKRSQKDGFKIELVNPLSRSSEGRRLTWKTEAAVQKHERDFNQFAREKLDERLKMLVSENVEMRRMMSGFYEALADNGFVSAGSGSAFNPGAFQLPWNLQSSMILKDMLKALETVAHPGNASVGRNGNADSLLSSTSEEPSFSSPSGNNNDSSGIASDLSTISEPNTTLISVHDKKTRRRLSSHSSGSGGSGTGSSSRRKSRGSLVNVAEIESYIRSVNTKSGDKRGSPGASGGSAAHSVATYERVTSPSHCSVILGSGPRERSPKVDCDYLRDDGELFYPPSRLYQGQPRMASSKSSSREPERSYHSPQTSEFTSSSSSTTCAEQTQNIIGFPGSFKVTVSVTDSQQHTHRQQQQVVREEPEVKQQLPDGSEDEEDDDEDDTRSVIMKSNV